MLDIPQTTHSEEDDTAVTEKQSKTPKNRKNINAEKQHIRNEKEGVFIEISAEVLYLPGLQIDIFLSQGVRRSHACVQPTMSSPELYGTLQWTQLIL